jgi:hypothetical protein
MRPVKSNIACVIGNGGIGDMITCIGMVNYIATKYDKVIVACMKDNYNQAKTFYKNEKIIIYSINDGSRCSMYEYCTVMIKYTDYDIYAFGNYGAASVDLKKYTKVLRSDDSRVRESSELCRLSGALVKTRAPDSVLHPTESSVLPNKHVKKIITCYPTSYYEDVDIPFEYASKYFSVEYPPEIIQIYEELFSLNMPYVVLHSSGSNVVLDPFEYDNIDENKYIVIDVNHNRYLPTHKYYNIANKFINLSSVLYYTKLLENAHDLYLIDSCIFALSLVINIDKVNMKVCYKRESRFSYCNTCFNYHLLAFPENYDKNNIKLHMIQ